MLISAEDLVASFYLVRMPLPWHRWFSFEKSVPASAVGVAGRNRVRICSVVLPMGFTSATGFMQAWHRHVVLRPNPLGDVSQAVLDPQTEVRGDRPFPLSARSSRGDLCGTTVRSV